MTGTSSKRQGNGMIFKGKERETAVWRRFRTSTDGFTYTKEGYLWTAHVVAPAERVADLFYVLTSDLPESVDIFIEDLRSGRSWKGEGRTLVDVREAVARLKTLVGRYGGLEISVYTDEDQLTLNPFLELFIYSRQDRWAQLLASRGMEEQARVRTKSWKQNRHQFPAAPELVSAIAGAVERLGLNAP